MSQIGKPENNPIAVIGAGSWGTALAILIARNGHPVRLWGRDPARLAHMANARENQAYLPDVTFPDSLVLGEDLPQLVKQNHNFLIAVPSHAFRTTLEAMVPHFVDQPTLAWATKGLERDTGKLLSEVIAETGNLSAACGVISGPTFAREVALGIPTAMVVASNSEETATKIADWLRNDRVRVYTNRDVVGVQVGGAIKNVMAIAAGISDGLGFGANTRAALITRGLVELKRLGQAMGGEEETFNGLTGTGDLILTCTDDTSRNRQVGLGLGKGRQLSEILAEIGQEAEGVITARELHHLAKAKGVDMPITEQVYRVLYEKSSPKDAVEALFQRSAKPE